MDCVEYSEKFEMLETWHVTMESYTSEWNEHKRERCLEGDKAGGTEPFKPLTLNMEHEDF